MKNWILTRRQTEWLLSGLLAVAVTVTSVSLIHTLLSHAQESQPTLQITSPPDGTVVAPGETITVVVTPATGINFVSVIIVGEDAIGFSEAKIAPPFEFSLTIPSNISPRDYQIRARAAITPGTGAKSSPITLIVEKPDPVLQLRAEPQTIYFEFTGDRIPLSVIGTFSDGKTLDIAESTRTTYSSNDPTVATVDSTGVVMAVGPGPIGIPEISTEIIVRNVDKSVVVPVIFHPIDNVTIDIKPGSHPNSINLGAGGTVPVAILSTADFDATTVDPLSVTLASAHVKLKGKGTPMASSQDVNGDGRLDLVVQVETEALQLSETSTKAILDGKTFSGMAIRGTDSVRVVP